MHSNKEAKDKYLAPYILIISRECVFVKRLAVSL